MEGADKTIRQLIADELKHGMCTAKDISRAVGIREKEVLEHLPHLARSLAHSGRFVIQPSECLDCGFVFRKRKRFKTPGRCPVCRSEGITETKYGISAE